MLGAHTYVAG
jgi:pyruvate dehydrogenase kinase 2/3/4